ncbi:MAG TPA: reverse transcriptase domain-containing protein [Pirellulaceae bacterium]|jgi:hypothetical protein|nr:reverse transcriptase domain-containing protein [Pirellulaceae bacterium]
MNGVSGSVLTRLLPGLFLPAADDGVEALASSLGVSAHDLTDSSAQRRWTYRRFEIRKRSGGSRTIDAPSAPLKRLQRALLHGWLEGEQVHDAATAFRPGFSIATHAQRHLGQELLATVDLSDFFPSTGAGRVRAWFREQGKQGQALEILMRLCVHRGSLPQGAPTSPVLSNLVNRKLDEQIAEVAAVQGARYTRYCDDLAFSWGTACDPTAFQMRIEDLLARYGYRVQCGKGWRVQRLDRRPEMVGLALDGGRLRLSTNVLKRMRGLSRRWFRTAGERERLQGYRGLLKMLKRY